MQSRRLILLLSGGLMVSCSHFSRPEPPGPPERPHRMEIHGDVRIDPYFWMKERESPEVLAHLKAENAHTEAVLAPVKGLRAQLAAEMKARIRQDDASHPFELHGYFYYQRFEPGKEYPVYARRKGSMSGPEELLLDVNELAKGHQFTEVRFPEPSPDSTKILYAADFGGRRFFDLFVKDLATGKLVGEPVRRTTGDADWAADSATIFFVRQDPETLRSRWLYRLDPSASETLVYEEKDVTFELDLAGTRTEDFLLLSSVSTLSTEVRILDARRPLEPPRVFLPREKNHEYGIEDAGDSFLVVSNWKARNFRLLKAPRRPSKKEEWKELLPNRDDTLLEGVSCFRTHYVLHERRKGQMILRAVDRGSGVELPISMPDPVYSIGRAPNPGFEAPFFRYAYESLHRPRTIYDYSFRAKTSALRKETEIPTYDSSRYESERVWAVARDGTWIPVSLVHRKGFQRDASAPMLVYGYGAYGASNDPSFEKELVSLLDRGFVYAIVHVRGGSEMGRAWYENGRQLQKMNSFTDFIDATEHLLRERYAAPGRVYANGASAGGLLMGAVANMRPELFRGINAGVPFVDVLTTMLDDSIPLTTSEYDEWGNPNEPEAYRYMAQYSPYDNVRRQAYPHLLITTGLHDSQVQYWEPAKWAAKLRRLNTGSSHVLLFTEMDSGHGGATGRFHALDQIAMEYAFYLMLDGQQK